MKLKWLNTMAFRSTRFRYCIFSNARVHSVKSFHRKIQSGFRFKYHFVSRNSNLTLKARHLRLNILLLSLRSGFGSTTVRLAFFLVFCQRIHLFSQLPLASLFIGTNANNPAVLIHLISLLWTFVSKHRFNRYLKAASFSLVRV